MRTLWPAAVTCVLLGPVSVHMAGQAPPRTDAAEPAFEVVSIRRTAAMGSVGFLPRELPDGGLRFGNTPVVFMLQRAYRGIVAGEIVGLPDWARRDGYDVNATSTLASASQEDRSAMMRAMLRERFGLLAHLERRPQPTLVLLPARPDGRLGTGLTKIDADCAKQEAERAAATRATGGLPALPDRSQPWPSCLLRLTSGPDGSTRIEGEGTLASLIQLLRIETRGVLVVDQSGVPGSFRVSLTYQVERGALAAAAEPPTGPDFTTALREQLGLKLDSVRIERDTLVVDRIERPTEN